MFEQAVRNTRTLFECARKAGVGRIVHISVTDEVQRMADSESGIDWQTIQVGNSQAFQVKARLAGPRPPTDALIILIL